MAKLESETTTNVESNDSQNTNQENVADDEDVSENTIEDEPEEITVASKKIEVLVEDEDKLSETEVLHELAAQYSSRSEHVVASILKQSKAEFKDNILNLSIPTGFKNETLNPELIQIKRFFVEKFPDKDFAIELTEVKTNFKSDIPYTSEEKAEDLLKNKPEIQDWFDEFGLKPDM